MFVTKCKRYGAFSWQERAANPSRRHGSPCLLPWTHAWHPAATINIVPLPHDKHFIGSLTKATNKKLSVLPPSVLSSIILPFGIAIKYSDHSAINCGWMPSWGSICRRQLLADLGSASSSRNTCLGQSEQKFWSGNQNTHPSRQMMRPVIFSGKWFNHFIEMLFETQVDVSGLCTFYLLLYFFAHEFWWWQDAGKVHQKLHSHSLWEVFQKYISTGQVKIISPSWPPVFSSLKGFGKESGTWWADLLVFFRTLYVDR